MQRIFQRINNTVWKIFFVVLEITIEKFGARRRGTYFHGRVFRSVLADAKRHLKMMSDPAVPRLKLFTGEFRSVYLKDLFDVTYPIKETIEHLRGVMEWLRFACKVWCDEGCAAGYTILQGGKWLSPYPETTGYIIPTIWDWAKIADDGQDWKELARKLSLWEVEIQFPSGAVRQYYYDKTAKDESSPAVFNTGMVIFGLVRAYKETGEKVFYDAAVRAGDWLVNMQDDDGVWRRGDSTMPTNPLRTYHTRVAWSLAELWRESDDEKYKEAARRNLNWALTRQRENGFFDGAKFHIDENPLTHTIAYTIEGLLGAGFIFGEERYIEAAEMAAESAMLAYERMRFFPATFDENWHSDDGYSCLTGCAQFSVIWQKIYQQNADARFLNAALKINDFLKSTQWLDAQKPEIRGAVKGSHPIYGQYRGKYTDYSKFNYVNWAAKFFADALMLEIQNLERLGVK
ncbi:MAG: beta-L-arabinofuranosidase domain-containing protein [bacterium]